VARLGAEIGRDHPDGVVLVAILKGSVVLLADLVRALDVPVEVDFVAISRFAPDSGRVRIVKDLELDVAGRPVVLVEDIVDTGLTLTWLLRYLAGHRPGSLRVCTLLDRVHRRIVPVDIHYRGLELEDEFLLGYGLDYAERYRNLDRLVVGHPRTLHEDPEAYVGDLYGRS
jgi:hypoxanthine phosphoribosyltransferase